ncbi:hypothetical protein [Salinisphaera sp.]|uniref:hypothetical protein n=1 Tax=Salinisphaera sp. TaxID=1914330 RepID=UPI000C51F78E|nr:hypothetical protein [Salinisphaera sp.]MBS62316.1 hypothetical protein [Salinisphaera sp.]
MSRETASQRPGPVAVLIYFLLAFPAAGIPALLFGIADAAGPQQKFEGSGGTGTVVAMLMAYVVALLVILGTYVSLHGKTRPLYMANGILGAMTLALLVTLSWQGII